MSVVLRSMNWKHSYRSHKNKIHTQSTSWGFVCEFACGYHVVNVMWTLHSSRHNYTYMQWVFSYALALRTKLSVWLTKLSLQNIYIYTIFICLTITYNISTPYWSTLKIYPCEMSSYLCNICICVQYIPWIGTNQTYACHVCTIYFNLA